MLSKQITGLTWFYLLHTYGVIQGAMYSSTRDLAHYSPRRASTRPLKEAPRQSIYYHIPIHYRSYRSWSDSYQSTYWYYDRTHTGIIPRSVLSSHTSIIQYQYQNTSHSAVQVLSQRFSTTATSTMYLAQYMSSDSVSSYIRIQSSKTNAHSEVRSSRI